MARLPLLILFACCASSWAKRCNETVAENVDDESITSWCGEVNVDWTGELIVAFGTGGEYDTAVAELVSQFPGDFPDGSLERLGSLHAFVAPLSAEHVRFLFLQGCNGGLKYIECNIIYHVPETFDSHGLPITGPYPGEGNLAPGIISGALSTLYFCLTILFAFISLAL